MTEARIEDACREAGLRVFCAYHPDGGTRPEGCETLFLLGPNEPGFWARVTASPENSGPDPVDRWSARVISALADTLGARALFPFGGPPYQPFVAWALASGQVWQSPGGLLVHDGAGLFVSFRGALAFSRKLDLRRDRTPSATQSPCETCADRPCLAACPAQAITRAGYDVGACHDWLDQKGGKTCLSGGCLVRRSCPAGQSYGRLEVQSAHHMRFFHKG